MFDRGARRFDVVETQLTLVKGEPAIFEDTVVYLPTNQNRVLIPLALTSLVRAGVKPLVAYTIVRLLSRRSRCSRESRGSIGADDAPPRRV